jgi:hypothetical protein
MQQSGSAAPNQVAGFLPNQVRYLALKATLDHSNLIREFRGSQTPVAPKSF